MYASSIRPPCADVDDDRAATSAPGRPTTGPPRRRCASGGAECGRARPDRSPWPSAGSLWSHTSRARRSASGCRDATVVACSPVQGHGPGEAGAGLGGGRGCEHAQSRQQLQDPAGPTTRLNQSIPPHGKSPHRNDTVIPPAPDATCRNCAPGQPAARSVAFVRSTCRRHGFWTEDTWWFALGELKGPGLALQLRAAMGTTPR